MSETAVPPKIAKPIKVTVDLKVVVEPGYIGYFRNVEEQTKGLERWARDFEAWVRDHRSQDPVGLRVEAVTRTECDQCSNLWETYEEDGKVFCAGCGRESSR